MRILFLVHAFNSLAKRLFVELQDRGHDLSAEFDINHQVALEAVPLAVERYGRGRSNPAPWITTTPGGETAGHPYGTGTGLCLSPGVEENASSSRRDAETPAE